MCVCVCVSVWAEADVHRENQRVNSILENSLHWLYIVLYTTVFLGYIGYTRPFFCPSSSRVGFKGQCRGKSLWIFLRGAFTTHCLALNIFKDQNAVQISVVDCLL